MPKSPAERKATPTIRWFFCSASATEEQKVLSMLKMKLSQPRQKRTQKRYRR